MASQPALSRQVTEPMGSDYDPRVLAILLGLAAMLYLLAWVVAGAPNGQEAAARTLEPEAVRHTLRP